MRTAKGSLIVAFALVTDTTRTTTAFRNYNCAATNNYWIILPPHTYVCGTIKAVKLAVYYEEIHIDYY
jgi:hypothetical protein